MNNNFRMPFIIILIFVAIAAFSGTYPISLLVFIIAIGGVVYLVGVKTNYDMGSMFAYVIMAFFVLLLVYLGLFKVGNYIPTLRRILLWPME